MPDDRIHDGHTAIFGQDSDTEPSALPSRLAAKAINRSFRGGKNRNRPPLVHKQFVFDDFSEPYSDIIRFGNVQGGMWYRRKKPGRSDGIILAIAGSLFHFTLVNEKWSPRFIASGNDPKLLHNWMEQAEEWLYVQDGNDEPWFWDGLTPSTARRSNTSLFEMPIGTIMRYIHGRMFVSNAFDQVAASDIMYGSGLTNSANVQKFTENIYWSEGGYFGLPTNLGPITGMIAMARQNRGNVRGQGELLITSIDGAQVIEAGVLRALWKDEQVQSLSLMGRGCVSSWSLINVNNDAFFRSDDGLTSYRIQMSEQQNSLSLSKISRQVNNWFEQDTQDMLQFTSSIYFDNRVLTTVSPFLLPSRESAWGSHRYFRGIISLDLDKASINPGDSDYNFDGLWTGIRPVVLINARNRAFAVSHDDDGENRIYEICRSGLNDEIDGTSIKPKWKYHTKRFSWIDTRLTNEFEVKRLTGGEVWASDVRDRINISASFRADNNPCWQEVLNRDFGTQTSGWKFSYPRYKRFKFHSAKEDCQTGLPYPPNHGAQFQFMIEGEGHAQIDRMRVSVANRNDPNSPVGDCNEPVDDPETVLDCAGENDYSYSIADSR